MEGDQTWFLPSVDMSTFQSRLNDCIVLLNYLYILLICILGKKSTLLVENVSFLGFYFN